MNLSKHMRAVVQAEADRIERELIGMVAEALLPQFRVSVSRDSDNTTERTLKTTAGVVRRAVSDRFEGDRAWLFCYASDSTQVYGWVAFVLGNEQDVISDYSTNLEKFIAPINKHASKYD